MSGARFRRALVDLARVSLETAGAPHVRAPALRTTTSASTTFLAASRASSSVERRCVVHGATSRRAHASEASDKSPASVSTPNERSDAAGTTSASARKDLYMMFTCGKCNTRAARGFSRQAYENGVVIVTCPGCQAKHVVADRMGWFGEPGSVEDFIAEKEKGDGDGRDFLAGTVKLSADGDGTLEINRDELEAWMKRFTGESADER